MKINSKRLGKIIAYLYDLELGKTFVNEMQKALP